MTELFLVGVICFALGMAFGAWALATAIKIAVDKLEREGY